MSVTRDTTVVVNTVSSLLLVSGVVVSVQFRHLDLSNDSRRDGVGVTSFGHGHFSWVV